MRKVYMVETLCRDNDTYYLDNVRMGYSTFERAKEVLDKAIMQEYNDLVEMKNDNEDYYIIDYDESKLERYEREIHIEIKDYEDLITRYTIVVVEVEE